MMDIYIKSSVFNNQIDKNSVPSWKAFIFTLKRGYWQDIKNNYKR